MKISVLTYSVEAQCHCFGVDEQFVSICFLLLDLKHLLLTKSCLFSFESLLSGSCLLLTLLVLLLLEFVLDLLICK